MKMRMVGGRVEIRKGRRKRLIKGRMIEGRKEESRGEREKEGEKKG